MDVTSLPSPTPTHPLQKIGTTREHPYCWTQELMDTQKKRWLLKQQKDENRFEDLALLFEIIGSEIAQSVGLPANRVTLLGTDECESLKVNKDRIATLHTWAKGKPGKASLVQKRKGPIPTGVTKRVVEAMSRHPIFPLMVAVDCFTGNSDRAENNLFYDPSSETYTAIDFAECFKANLAKLTHDRVKTFAELGETQRRALLEFAKGLSQLIKLWPADKIEKRLDALAGQHGFMEGGSYDTWSVQQHLIRYRATIQESCKDTQKLIESLSTVLGVTV